jgi:hypothetical protein
MTAVWRIAERVDLGVPLVLVLVLALVAALLIVQLGGLRR